MPRKPTNCKFCGMIADRKEIYCSYCGHKIGEDVEDISESLKPETLFSFDTSCSQCGQERKNTERFCLGCGHDFTVPPAPFMTEEPPIDSFDISKKRWDLKVAPFETITGTLNIPIIASIFNEPHEKVTTEDIFNELEAQLQAEEDGLIQKPQIEPCEIKPQNEPPIEILKQEAEKTQEEFDEYENFSWHCCCYVFFFIVGFLIILGI